MKILYDGEIYGQQVTGGISRYFYNIIQRLSNDCYPVVTTCCSGNLHYPNHANLDTVFFKRFGFKPGQLSYWLEKQFFRTVENAGRFDILHPTYYTLLTRRQVSSSKLPVVLTVYDMIHEIFPSQLDPTGEFAEIKRRAILSAQLILCISESTKQDLLERIPISEKRVIVTHLATELDISISDPSAKIPNIPYFLYVGGRHLYKNFNCVLDALARVKSRYPELKLCVVGAPLSLREQELIARLKLEKNIEDYGYVDDAHLVSLYSHSLALVYPSHYEGFGIPLLEAMSCGTTVIASNSSSIPEVVGDSGLLFDSQESDDLTEKMLILIEDSSERDRLVKRGKQQVKKFSWDRAASETEKAYRSLVPS